MNYESPVRVDSNDCRKRGGHRLAFAECETLNSSDNQNSRDEKCCSSRNLLSSQKFFRVRERERQESGYLLSPQQIMVMDLLNDGNL